MLRTKRANECTLDLAVNSIEVSTLLLSASVLIVNSIARPDPIGALPRNAITLYLFS